MDHIGPSFTLKNFNQESDVMKFCKGHAGHNGDKHGSEGTRSEVGTPGRKLS